VRTSNPDNVGFEREKLSKLPRSNQYKTDNSKDASNLKGKLELEEGKYEFDRKFNVYRENSVKGKNNNVKVMVGEEPETVDEYINDRIMSEVKKHHKIKFNC
jgi:hypothetical protein